VVRGLAAWKKWNSILSPPENQARAGRACSEQINCPDL
jgi:hypothetical protein